MKRRTVSVIAAALAFACAVAAAAEIVVQRYVDHPWEALPAFYALYSLVACIVLVLAARGMRKAVRRREDHYEAAHAEEER